MGHGNGLNEH